MLICSVRTPWYVRPGTRGRRKGVLRRPVFTVGDYLAFLNEVRQCLPPLSECEVQLTRKKETIPDDHTKRRDRV